MNSSSNTTNSNHLIPPPLGATRGDSTWSIFDWLFSLLPNSMKQELRNRVPATDFSELSAIDVLHFQYNIVVLLIGVTAIIVRAYKNAPRYAQKSSARPIGLRPLLNFIGRRDFYWRPLF